MSLFDFASLILSLELSLNMLIVHQTDTLPLYQKTEFYFKVCASLSPYITMLFMLYMYSPNNVFKLRSLNIQWNHSVYSLVTKIRV